MRAWFLSGLVSLSGCQTPPPASPSLSPEPLEGLSRAAPLPADVLLLGRGQQHCGDILFYDNHLHTVIDSNTWLTLDTQQEQEMPAPDGALLAGLTEPLWLSRSTGRLYSTSQHLHDFSPGVRGAAVIEDTVWTLTSAGLQSTATGAHTAARPLRGAQLLSTDGSRLLVLSEEDAGWSLLSWHDPIHEPHPQRTRLQLSAPSAMVAMVNGGAVIAGQYLSRWTDQGDRRWIRPLDQGVLQLLDAGDRLVAISSSRLQIHDAATGDLTAQASLHDACSAALGRTQVFVRDPGGVSAYALEDGRLLSRKRTVQRPSQVVTDRKTHDRFVLDPEGGAIYVWRPDQTVHRLPEARHPIAMSLYRGALIALDLGGELLVWDVLGTRLRQRIPTGTSGAGQLAHDRDHEIAAVLYPGRVVVLDLRGALLWEGPAPVDGTIAAGTQRVYVWDAGQNMLTSYQAHSGQEIASRPMPAPPNRSILRSRPLFFDPTTDRLFCGRDILDGSTLKTLGRVEGIDQIVHADQEVIVGRRAARGGTTSAVLIDAISLVKLSHTPLIRIIGSAGSLSYDPLRRRLYVSEPERGRVIVWPYPQ